MPETKLLRALKTEWGLRPCDIALVALLLAAPVLAHVFLLPTFHIDTAETVMWGRYLPWLGTHKHPPVMGWFGAVVEMLPGAAAWQATLVQILLNLVGIAYFHAIGGFVLQPAMQRLVTIGLTVSLLMTVWPVAGYALNADIVAIPFWAGALYHVMAARHGPEKPLNWLAAGLFLGLSLLTKYFAVLLATAILLATLIVPAYRRLWRRPWPYVALMVACAVVAPHVYWALHHLDKLDFIAGRLSLHAMTSGAVLRLSLANLVLGFIVLGIPMLSLATGWSWIQQRAARLDWRQWLAGSDRRFLFWVFALLLLLAVISIVWGIFYQMRFSAPLYGLFALLWFMALPLPPDPVLLLRRTLWMSGALWGLAYGALALLYLPLGSHNYAQEPAKQMASVLKAEWNARFACGPAYIMGERRPAQVLSVYYGRPVMGVPFDEVGLARWHDAARAADRGVIYVVWSEDRLAEMKAQLPPGAEIFSTELPRLRTWRDDRQRYWYGFVPPKACG